MFMPHMSAVAVTLARYARMVSSDSWVRFHCVEGGVHAGVEHALQEGLVTGSLQLLQLYRVCGSRLADVGVPEVLCEFPRGLQGFEKKILVWVASSVCSCHRSSGLMSSNTVSSLRVDVEEVEH